MRDIDPALADAVAALSGDTAESPLTLPDTMDVLEGNPTNHC
ncbi:hypothetical protein [Streptomyces clavuligerus]|uniref:Uncharacterized protein n=1 Tax=Streptomyces clavuligerus TaxID=1901 RepID=B5GN91_STRCL|nr:hypothetical protein [Streptomyces clavuligerus]EDY47787.1 hypothetical protein SSCG_00815 [Streptomyces clavuligerus]EFG04224.1 Hypothetical protein SCLAV_p0737 [Streptomyces clavuligerus]